MTLRKIINLSPLVDVLMIVIFWYIMMSNQTIEATQENAQNELEALKSGYEAQLTERDAENAGLSEELEKLLGEREALIAQKEELLDETELSQKVNEDLSAQLQALREENRTLGIMLEQSVGYVYVRLTDGLNENRVVTIDYENELVDKFIFSDGEEQYMEQRIRKVVEEYAGLEEKQRIAVIFVYEGDNSLYFDITRIMNVLYMMRSELGISVHTINMAE